MKILKKKIPNPSTNISSIPNDGTFIDKNPDDSFSSEGTTRYGEETDVDDI